MSQPQVLEIVEIPVDKIRPSPYQPRLEFGLEELRGSIIQYGIRDPLKVRRVGDYWELIDGERRWRIAQQEGMKTIPCLILDYSDEEADALSWRFNIERKDYSLEERAKHFKKHQNEGLSGAAIGRIHGYSHVQVTRLLAVFRLPEKYQNYLWTGEFAYQKFEYIYDKGLLNGKGGKYLQDVTNLIDESAERRLTQREFENVIDDYLSDLEKRQVEEAKKAAVQLETSKRREEKARDALGEPEVKEPVTSEEFEEAARALRERAKELKTPEQILEEKREKARNALLTGKGNIIFKIEKAKELGIDTKWMEEEKEKIENKIPFSPDNALSDANAVKSQINDVISRHQERQKEVTVRKKVEKEFEDEKIEEIKEELRKDETFKAELRTELMKEMVSPSRIETLPIEIPEEEARVLRERIEAQRQKMTEWMLDPEIQKRGKLFKNWVAHGAMLDVMGSAFCPEHSEESTWKDLKWSCGLSVEEAYEMLRKKLEKGR
jgi:ParB family chromosome partitioning protein